jgi:hypothetical protein
VTIRWAEEVGWGGSGGLKVSGGGLLRVTNPERFRPLHGSAERLLGRLEATFDVEREEGYELDDEFDRHAARPTVRLAPRSTEGGSLTIVVTSFPGLLVRLGHWVVEPVPVCGCEACDETAEQKQARLESMVADLNDGSAHQSIRLRLWADGWLVRGAPDPHEVSRIGRARLER